MSEDLIDQLKRHEGFRAKPYLCTAGHQTVGYGLNLDEGITEFEANWLLRHRVMRKRLEVIEALPWSYDAPVEVQTVLVNMAYNLGVAGLLKFVRMLEALEREDYATAADEMLDSRWAKQVGQRAHELASQIRTLGHNHVRA